MKIRYIYSATVVISTEDCTILCDPWWGNCYDGSWVQWPPWAKSLDEAVEVCGPADLVFVSHVHPDHYDPAFLKAYLAKYPNAKVLIAEQDPPLLERKLQSRGINPSVGLTSTPYTAIETIPNRVSTGVNIDSALVVSTSSLSVANLNDNPYDQKQIDLINEACNGHPTVALLPFVGAGPWPQCYAFDTPEQQLQAAEAKKQKGLALFRRYCEALQPKVAVPFAGQYFLHGPQLDLNPLRGMADATECHPYNKHVWMPADGGRSVMTVLNEEEWTVTSWRDEPYDWPTVRRELCKQALTKYDNPADDHSILRYRYEREIQVPVERLPLLKLLQSAVRNTAPGFFGKPYLHIYIKTQFSQWFHFMTNSMRVVECDEPNYGNNPRVEVFIDARYLYGMLTRLYNANSVRIGSLCRFKVVPNFYDKELDDLFGEFWDSLRV